MRKVLPMLGFLLFSYYLFAQDKTADDSNNTDSKVIIELNPWLSCENGIYYNEELPILPLEKSVATKNVGIGLTNPVYKLHAAGDIYANGGWLRASGEKGLYFQSYGGGLYMSDATWIRTYGNKSFYHNTGTMRTDGTFQVGPSGDRFIVNTSGNVGIGTTTPEGNLDITSSTTPMAYIQSSASSSQDAILNIRGSRTTSTTSDIAQLIFGSNDAGGGDLASITARKQTANTNEGNLLFWTTTTNGETPSEKMRIDKNGNVGIGTTSPLKKLDVNGDINFTGNLYKNEALVNLGLSAWTIVDNGNADDGATINQALNDYDHVSLLPNKTYKIKDTRIIIGVNDPTAYPLDAKTLYVPASTIIEFDRVSPSFSAVELRSNGNLIGEGRIKMKDTQWSWAEGKAAVMITGSYCKLNFGTIQGFEYGISMGGPYGVQACNINVKYFQDNVILVYMKPQNSNDSWINQNYIHINGMNTNGARRGDAAWVNSCGIYMDPGVVPHVANMNTFSGHIEGMNIGIKLTGKFNRLEGLRLENCVTRIQIVGPVVENNYLYGSYGEITGLESTNSSGQTAIENLTSSSLSQVLSIYGMDEFTYMNLAYQRGSFISSDANLKTDIEDVNGALNKILALRGTSYNFKSDHKEDQPNNLKKYGFIAQELKEVLPELVEKNPLDGMYAVNYDGVIPVLVEAFKEQQELIDKRDQEVAELIELNQNLVDILKRKGILDEGELDMVLEEPILYQNVPNPFNSVTEIEYFLPYDFSEAYIYITDMNGRYLKKVEIYTKGRNKVSISSNDLNSGMYIYSLIADDKVVGTKRMILTE